MILRLALAASLVLAAAPLYATTYTIEPDYTQAVFRWSHLGFSNPAAQLSQGQGTLEFDPANPTRAAVNVTIALSSLNTGVPALDEHLRSEDFFEVAKFPTASFRSTKVEQGAGKDRLKVTGELNLHGITRPVTLDVAVLKIGANPRTQLPTVGFEATTTLKRSDFGLGAFVPQVSDEIKLQISSQGVEAKGYAEYLKKQAEKK
ncbi:MAG TPA: YceI family protein [Steroidobacteraceae bacterium]|jgi:polyisoprenoid-binding protein YceI|nr:YceI family protein [Steroidobacteraceae bacterium]